MIDKEEIEKQKRKLEDTEKTIVIGEVIGNFIKEEPKELSSEEEIIQFKIKREIQAIKNMTEEEKKKKEEEARQEEEELQKQKRELLDSLQKRIPAIEKRIYGQVTPTKKESLKVNGKGKDNIQKTNQKEIAKEGKDKEKGFERE